MISPDDLARLRRAHTDIARVLGLAQRVSDHVRGVRWQKTANYEAPPGREALVALLRSIAADVLLVAEALEQEARP